MSKTNEEVKEVKEVKKANQTHELFEKGNYKKKEKVKEEPSTVDFLKDVPDIEKPKKKKKSTKIVAWVLIAALVGSSLLTSLAMFM